MKKLIFFFSISLISVCQNWSFLGYYEGESRHHPITFSNDRYGFVIAGQNGQGEYLDDVYKYDSQLNTWEQLNNFPGGPRGYAYGVSNDQYGYVGFGSNENNYPNDWWRYEMSTNTWLQLADFPDLGRNHPAMILTEEKIYVGLGSADGENFGDWWEYDINNDNWTQKANFNFGNRHHPFYFSINNTPYVGFGHGDYINDNITIYNDFYKFNSNSNEWIQLNNFPSEGRVAGTQFSFAGKGYILSGDGDDHGPLDSGEIWEYDPEFDNWTQLTSHPGGARWAPGSFVIDCDVYLTSGYEAETDTYYNDLFKYKISSLCGCTNEDALNFNVNAEIDDNSCCFISGCTDSEALNYDPEACFDDNSCIDIVLGCNDQNSSNYNPDANTSLTYAGPNYLELGTGGYHYNDMWDMTFNCYENVTIKTIDLISETEFTTQIEILDNYNNQIFLQSFQLNQGLNEVNINFELNQGSNYKIGINGDNQGLFRNNNLEENTFPINLHNVIEITSNTTDSPYDYYYYFYNWQLEINCDEINQNECNDELACNYLNPVYLNDSTCLYPFDECVNGIEESGELIYGVYDENCNCIINDSNYTEQKNPLNKIIKKINVLGKEKENGNVLIYIYNDGNIKKVINPN